MKNPVKAVIVVASSAAVFGVLFPLAGGSLSSSLGLSSTVGGCSTVGGQSTVGGSSTVGGESSVCGAPTTPFVSNLPAVGFVGSSFVAVVNTNGDGVKFVEASGSCTVVNRLTVQFTGVGDCSLTAEVTAGTTYPQAAGEPQTVTVSVPPPTTAVIIPSSGTAQSGTAALVDATASPGVTSVTFEISGGTLSNDVIATATPTIYGWLAQWNTTSVADGTYTLRSVASFASGPSGTSPGITITVDH